MTGYTTNLSQPLRDLILGIEQDIGMELEVNSGYRDPEHNAAVGGVPESEHTDDPANRADVKVLRSVTRMKVVHAALLRGCRRIGIGKTFVHLGVSPDKPQDVCWVYYE